MCYVYWYYSSDNLTLHLLITLTSSPNRIELRLKFTDGGAKSSSSLSSSNAKRCTFRCCRWWTAKKFVLYFIHWKAYNGAANIKHKRKVNHFILIINSLLAMKYCKWKLSTKRIPLKVSLITLIRLLRLMMNSHIMEK